MLGNLNGWHLVIILAVVLLLFGAPKLPGLARSIGQSMRIFRSEVKTMKDENGDVVAVETVEEQPPAAKTTAAKTTTAKPAANKPKK
ncbi:MAG: tatA [Rhodoglobus sp.]|nr:tatA [Rhodoglobus sp.]